MNQRPTSRRRGLHWRRFDTLGLRLFVLMWVTLVVSHLAAYSVSFPLMAPNGPDLRDRMSPQRLPTLPSLPPSQLLEGRQGNRHGPPPGMGPPPGGPADMPGPDMRGPAGLPAAVLWLDYGVRMAIIALGAALGARWLARPMQRLAAASRALSQGRARSQPPPVLDEQLGTHEVREAAQVFNTMATQLQEQFDARGMHLASVSHDLRTPLTRLRMRLEDAPPALADAAAADIHEMSEMIDTTLEVLREQREGGQARAVDMHAMLEAIVDDLAAAGHDVALQDAHGAGGPAGGTPDPVHALQAKARPAALKRILGNLVGNALRYGGNARLTLLAADGGITVTVDDNGPGIPPDQLELAFRPWVRLTSAHARSGHGLGLAIARDLAERDGGSITLANRVPTGLQARLWLPLA